MADRIAAKRTTTETVTLPSGTSTVTVYRSVIVRKRGPRRWWAMLRNGSLWDERRWRVGDG